MRFVVELKKGRGGWVSPGELKEERFINDIEHRQRYSQLREHFKGSLKAKDGEKFIECDRSKGYRLSTHPDFVGLKHNMPLFLNKNMSSLAKLCYP